MPPFMLGVSVIRGQVVPVVDLASLTGVDGGTGGTPGSRYVTLDLDGRLVALAVDEVIGVRSLAASALGEVPPLLNAAEAGMVTALTTLDAELMIVLQASHLIPDSLWPVLAVQGAAA